MNIIRSIILDLAGGSMETYLLSMYTLIVFVVLFVAVGIACAYVTALLVKDNASANRPITVKDAQ